MLSIDRELLELSCRDMLFAHWPVEAEALRPYVPHSLMLDTYDGSAWIGFVAFQVHSIEAANISIPMVAPFLNLNLRTFVRDGSQTGIYFLSSDIDSQAATAIGHRLFGFAVYQARMHQRNRNGGIDFRSERTGHEGRKMGLQVRYEPTGDVFQPEPGSVEKFLIERSRYYLGGEPDRTLSDSPSDINNGSVRTGETEPSAHRLRSVDLDIRVNTLLNDFEDGLLSDDPTAYYCERRDSGWNPLESAFG